MTFVLLCAMSAAQASPWAVSLGTCAPSKGLLGLERYFVDDLVSANVHLGCYEENYMSMGVSAAYHPWKMNGPYVFHTSQWVSGSGTVNGINLSDNNYWRLVLGLGWQHAFFAHFGAFAEAGVEAYAGNGGYYTDFEPGTGRLSNGAVSFPIGLGVIIPF